jgi:squalene-hopene/tetraprenyl-beta-curcumene cyclase
MTMNRPWLALVCGLGLLAACRQETAPAVPPSAPAKPKPAAAAPKPATAEPEGIPPLPATHQPQVPESVRLEAEAGLSRGVNYLVATQQEDGAWSAHPGITAMSVVALAESPDAATPAVGKAVDRGLAYLRGRVGPDGSVARVKDEEDVYSSAVCLMAFVVLNRPEDAERIGKLRTYLVKTQVKSGFEYGIGYKATAYPDLSNTYWALEAVRLTQGNEPDLQTTKLWQRTVGFVSSCQVLQDDDPKLRGGFLYYPADKRPEKLPYGDIGPVWGSLTLGGLKSLLFAGVPKDDPRVQAGLAWLRQNYALAQNPGLDQGGLYYYYYMFASGLIFLQEDRLADSAGREHNWRHELVTQLLVRQKGRGQWQNDNSALWLEGNAPLCTAYAMKALEFALRD